jgi:Flp pilus assembly pilin Flp
VSDSDVALCGGSQKEVKKMFAPLYIYSYVTGALSTVKAPSRNERGASFTEYVVLLAAIVAVVAAGVVLLGSKITAKLNGLTL